MTNEDLSRWNVGRVTNMYCMCKWATAGVRGCWRGLVSECCADPLAPPPPSQQSTAPPRLVAKYGDATLAHAQVPVVQPDVDARRAAAALRRLEPKRGAAQDAASA